jgi:hypothetical protein
MTTQKSRSEAGEHVSIPAPKFQVAEFVIIGTAPYVQNQFSQKAREMMKAKQQAGSVANKGKKRDPKDFHANYVDAQHKTADGHFGIPASAFRAASISACRLVGFKMTLAKLSVFIEADGFDAIDGTPLVFFTKGKPKYCEHATRNESGVADIRARAMWDAGWEARLRVRYDSDQFTLTDVTNLLSRVGQQVGIGEGRPDSPNSCGMGWGFFKLGDGK